MHPCISELLSFGYETDAATSAVLQYAERNFKGDLKKVLPEHINDLLDLLAEDTTLETGELDLFNQWCAMHDASSSLP